MRWPCQNCLKTKSICYFSSVVTLDKYSKQRNRKACDECIFHRLYLIKCANVQMCKCANHLFQDISIETHQQYKILQEDLMGALAKKICYPSWQWPWGYNKPLDLIEYSNYCVLISVQMCKFTTLQSIKVKQVLKQR